MVKDNTLRYLHCYGESIPDELNTMIDECIEEVKQIATPAFMHQRFTVSHHPLYINELELTLDYSDIEKVMAGCSECIVVAITLGVEIERKLRYYALSDMTRMSVLDAAASSYIESLCDTYEETLHLDKRTIRYCAGYGNVPIAINRILSNALQTSKHIGLFVGDSDILMPQKSMIGMIGVGNDNKEKGCFSCIRKQSCEYRKQGKVCYLKD